MIKFLQFINEANDFTYTTDQGKTDQHVKGFVSDFIKNPQVELDDSGNGVSVTGSLVSSYNKLINVDVYNKQIAITSDLSKLLTSIVSNLVTNMTDQSVVSIKATDTDGDAIPQGDTVNYTLTVMFTFDGDKFDGTANVTLNTLSDTDSNITLSSSDKCNISLNCEWRES